MQRKARKMMNCVLFEGIDEQDLPSVLKQLNAVEIQVEKNQIVLNSGETVRSIYLCTEGGFVLETVDSEGALSILSTIEKGGLFGGAFAFTESFAPADLRATEKSKMLVIPIEQLKNISNADKNKTIILYNLALVLAKKSTYLITKIKHLSKRSIRSKIMSYLSELTERTGKQEVMIPFDRQGLADYICVDRSALSKELSKMKSEGLIDYKKNKFTVKFNHSR